MIKISFDFTYPTLYTLPKLRSRFSIPNLVLYAHVSHQFLHHFLDFIQLLVVCGEPLLQPSELLHYIAGLFFVKAAELLVALEFIVVAEDALHQLRVSLLPIFLHVVLLFLNHLRNDLLERRPPLGCLEVGQVVEDHVLELAGEHVPPVFYVLRSLNSVHHTPAHYVIDDVGVFFVARLAFNSLDLQVKLSTFHSDFLDLIIREVEHCHCLGTLAVNVALVSY